MKLLTTQNFKLLKNNARLLTKNNPKLLKGKSWLSFGVHLSPYNLSGKNLCPFASKGCIDSCLNKTGHGYSNRVQFSRLKKTVFFLENRKTFLQNLKNEIAAKVKSAKGKNICCRLNLTSDLAWENIKIEGKSLMDHFPTVQFYDYTKNPSRMFRFLNNEFPKNYHLTFSRSETNKELCKIISGCGGNIAVVFFNKLPKTHMRKKVIDGTKDDLRFLDKKGVIVGLLALGQAKKDKTGFVVKNRYGY